eukprot:TCALIF_04747-PA protein Name:"Similar to CG4692 Putative ATP synthase subunit f, mitochondrial (Drosophila melanogaster)" AED:0.06 eAED:0.06 QI:0/-1/0/1/-1/1/1/0/117
MFGFGELPKEYNVKIHGPYDPAVYYGPKDTPLSEVKLGQLPAWLSRRSKNPVDWVRAGSRGYWRWSHKYLFPKHSGIVPVVQMAVGLSFFFWALNMSDIRKSFKFSTAPVNYAMQST